MAKGDVAEEGKSKAKRPAVVKRPTKVGCVIRAAVQFSMLFYLSNYRNVPVSIERLNLIAALSHQLFDCRKSQKISRNAL
jgi:hypothetical protein